MSTKLSKRKQKALAFRGKQKNKSAKDTENEELKAIPAEEESEENPAGTRSWLGNDAVSGPSATKRKRKRETDDDNTPESSKPVKSKSTATTPAAKKSKPSTEKPAQKRFIVFVGNLPHVPSTELLPSLQSHFPDPPKSIRIPTKKGTNAPQGFAFLEFDTASALEKALRCHHTLLLKRKINVELTAGGGGKSATRMAKVKQKNEGLEEERRTRIEEEKKNKLKEDKSQEGIHPDRLKRMKGGK